MSEKLTVAEALARAEMIDRSLDAWQGTAPQGIEEMGGRDAFADRCEMACFGPVPRLEHDEWQRLSLEYEDRRANGSINRGEG